RNAKLMLRSISSINGLASAKRNRKIDAKTSGAIQTESFRNDSAKGERLVGEARRLQQSRMNCSGTARTKRTSTDGRSVSRRGSSLTLASATNMTPPSEMIMAIGDAASSKGAEAKADIPNKKAAVRRASRLAARNRTAAVTDITTRKRLRPSVRP